MPLLIAIDDSLQWDIAKDGYQLATDSGLFSMAARSLFEDAAVTVDDLVLAGLPPEQPSGYWGDAFPLVDGDKVGSKLHLLKRMKRTELALQLGKQWSKEALAWMVADGMAESIDTDTAWWLSSGHQVIRTLIIKPDGQRFAARWAYALGDNATSFAIVE